MGNVAAGADALAIILVVVGVVAEALLERALVEQELLRRDAEALKLRIIWVIAVITGMFAARSTFRQKPVVPQQPAVQ
jgi:hypothetical protein